MGTTIVTGVDGSETADKAARAAARLASALGMELRVVTAFDRLEVDRFSVGGEQLTYSTADSAERVAERVADALRRTHPDLTVTASAAEGKPGDVLVEAARQLEAHLIVVGNKRVQGLARVLGSVARDVATQAGCDVYVAHTHAR